MGDAVGGPRGGGPRRAKSERLRELLGRAAGEERELLQRILLGEMRTGLHEGLLVEALARAADTAPNRVRRAALFLSGPSEVARIALSEGAAGLGDGQGPGQPVRSRQPGQALVQGHARRDRGLCHRRGGSRLREAARLALEELRALYERQFTRKSRGCG
jgi:ATP-dependent DNA ligase